MSVHKQDSSAEKKSGFIKPGFLRRTGLSGPVTFAILVVAIIFVLSIFLRVSEIYVEGNEHYTDEEIIRAIDIEEGDNLFFFDRFGAISRVFAKLPYAQIYVSMDGSDSGDGSIDALTRKILLGCTGGVISVFIIVMAIYMINQSNKKLKELKRQRMKNGKQGKF